LKITPAVFEIAVPVVRPGFCCAEKYT
jgi:hypothetical protein